MCFNWGNIGHTANVCRNRLIITTWAQTFNGHSYNYGKFGHMAYECRSCINSRYSGYT